MEVWERELARAWRTAAVAGIEGDVFATRVQRMVQEQLEGEATSIFTTNCSWTAHFSERKLPTPSDVLAFYNKVVRVQDKPLPALLQVAAAVAMTQRSAEFVLLGASFAYFLRKRFEAFVKLLPGQESKWTLLQTLRVENFTRLLDETTWVFISFYDGIAQRAAVDHSNVMFFIIRSVFCCCPQAYDAKAKYMSIQLVARKFNRSAYNHLNGTWANLCKVLTALAEREVELGQHLKAFLNGTAAVAVRAGKELLQLLSAPGFRDFNTQETLWNVVLLRERFAAAGKIENPGIMTVRRGLFETCQWGTGGLSGLRLFFPGASAQKCGKVAEELRLHMEVSHGITFSELHGVQWGSCAFQKTMNKKGYKRKYTAVLKPLKFFATWHVRVSEYPSGAQLFRSYVAGLGEEAVEQWVDFLAKCKIANDIFMADAAMGNVSCRACWKHAGLSVSDRDYTHMHFKNLGAVCKLRSPAKRKRE